MASVILSSETPRNVCIIFFLTSLVSAGVCMICTSWFAFASTSFSVQKCTSPPGRNSAREGIVSLLCVYRHLCLCAVGILLLSLPVLLPILRRRWCFLFVVSLGSPCPCSIWCDVDSAPVSSSMRSPLSKRLSQLSALSVASCSSACLGYVVLLSSMCRCLASVFSTT